MPILGTKKFWIPPENETHNQRGNQILKNSGYINLQLKCVHYMSKGNFWQKNLGGKDKIVLTTNLKYQTGVDFIEASAIQDIRKVRANKNHNLGLQRNLAVKIPANCDSIIIEVKLTAIKSDSLETRFKMLNEPQFQSALQLTPTIIGQLTTVTSLVKKLLTDSSRNPQLEASFAGIISNQSEDNPVSNGKLTKGSLIMISTNEGNSFNNTNESKFELRGDTLYYDKKEVENTSIVFNITFEPFKGDDENALWFKKYVLALSQLDQLHIYVKEEDIKKIYEDSKKMWIEGNALLDADPSYVQSERRNIKNDAINRIKEKYTKLTKPETAEKITDGNEILEELAGSTSIYEMNNELPSTGKFLNRTLKIDPNIKTNFQDFNKMKINNKTLSAILKNDSKTYQKNLRLNSINFNLGKLV